MEVKHDFLTRFLVRKQLELSEILASRRTRNYMRREGGSNTKFLKFKDKTFQMTELNEEEDVTEEVISENVFLSAVGKESSGKSKGPCPIKCGMNHINSSLFFCRKYRKKNQEERKAIQKKMLNLCILCLGYKSGKHDCPVTKCPRCGAGHNILLCPTEESDRAFTLNENTEENEWTENDEALANPDKCYMIKKTKTLEHKDVGRNPMEEVKTALKELISEQRKNNNQDDRAAFMQVGRFDYVRFLQEIRCYEKTSDSETLSDKSRDTESEAEFVTATGSEMEEENSVKRSVESKQSEETTSSSRIGKNGS